MIRLLLHSPAKSVTLEVMKFDKEANEVTVLCWQSGHVYKMPYDPPAWERAGWVRQKVDDLMDDVHDARLPV